MRISTAGSSLQAAQSINALLAAADAKDRRLLATAFQEIRWDVVLPLMDSTSESAAFEQDAAFRLWATFALSHDFAGHLSPAMFDRVFPAVSRSTFHSQEHRMIAVGAAGICSRWNPAIYKHILQPELLDQLFSLITTSDNIYDVSQEGTIMIICMVAKGQMSNTGTLSAILSNAIVHMG
eukprot:jgi/Hompol1/2834/HPOL_006213-RA